MAAHMTRMSVKGDRGIYIDGLLGVGSRLGPMHDAARQSEPYPAHIRSPLAVAAPLSRLRRLRAQESETSLSGGAERQQPFRFACLDPRS
jgi:hypothetical protein